ncbi:hypothetical protein P170DRAFT_427454 [Aspergillus steynii IBT 23096]|uniref:F-box domain-containing protein n=1 Tax=Aspergillus steynii IBT 23096 TaxID=1392250 RepID=A0A2I2G673_9EURO|nr:uncharacterized protein P170DRAFT_427454 [Aspergillus steynii IBT 23096]PLB48368.1 hypothetical protein P170DRAFT_427454 [Aspergillus steynii IBT 23096]
MEGMKCAQGKKSEYDCELIQLTQELIDAAAPRPTGRVPETIMAQPQEDFNEPFGDALKWAPALPMEIIQSIFSHVAENCNMHDWYRLSLVNHSWYSAATKQLYHSFKNHGDLKDRERLWQFMRTVVEEPDLAKIVKAVDLIHCFKYTGPASPFLAESFCTKYRSALIRGIQESGIDRYQDENDILEALQTDDRRPIVSIILACLSNLETLSMHVTNNDIYLRAVAQNAPIHKDIFPAKSVRSTLAFKQVKRLFLDTDDQPYGNVPLEIDRYQPFIYFPQLCELTLLHCKFNVELFSWSFGGIGEARPGLSSNLTKVTIDLFRNTRLEELLKFLDGLTALTSLCIDFSSIPRSEWDIYGPTALWDHLLRFKETLKKLDIYYLDIPQHQPSPPEFCPPIHEFINLKSLSIGPAMLLGNCKKHRAPFQLMEHVPCGLDYLGLYGDPGFIQGPWAVPEMESQLEALAMNREPKAIDVQLLGKRCALLPISKLRAACKQKRIRFDTKRMNRGGSGSEFGLSSHRHARPHNPDMYQALLQIGSNITPF